MDISTYMRSSVSQSSCFRRNAALSSSRFHIIKQFVQVKEHKIVMNVGALVSVPTLSC